MPITNGQASNNGSGGGGGGGNINYIYKGTYDASNNTPPLANGTGSVGWWYLTTVEGIDNPTGQLLKVNQIIAYNGTVWQAGGQIDNSDEIIVAPDYVVIRGQTIQVGQSLTVALGALEGEIADLSQNIANALSGKANLVANPSNGDILTTDAQGQPVGSGVKLANLTQQVNTNTSDIGALKNTTTQQGQNIQQNTQDIQQLQQDLEGKQNTVPAATDGNLASFAGGSTADSGISKDVIGQQGQSINTNTQDIQQLQQDLEGKQNLVPNATNDHVATLGADGQTKDSGIDINTLATKTYVGQNTVTSIGKDTPVSGAITFTGAGITQNGNNFNIPAAADGGATALVVESPNNTIQQIGASEYIDATRTIKVQLQGIGDGSGTVTKVSSANTDIDVANQTTEPVLTLNSTVDGGVGAENKIPKLNADGEMGSVPVGANALVTNPKTLLASTLNQALADAYGSMPNITIANTVFVGKNGSAQGAGAINNLYPTIQAAIDASPSNTQIFVYASGLATATAYTENLTLKPQQVITGASSQFVVIAGTITTPSTAGSCYLENLRIQPPSNAGNISVINFVGGTNITNLQLHNVDINLYGGTGSCINWTNTNANSRLVTDGTSAWNVSNSTNGAKLFTSAAGTAGLIILQNVSAQLIDNTNRVAYSIGGAIRFYHTLDNIYGQVVVSNTAAFFGTFLTINTGNVAALVTNSSSFSTLNSCVMTTTANAIAGTAVVEGAGAFAFYQTSTPNTTVKGYATTLNGGIGAIAAATYSIRLDSSGIAPFTAGTSDGLIQYDGSNYFVDTLTARNKLVTADNVTNKLLSTWLNYNQTPTFANKVATDVISSAAFWSAVAQIAGTNLTYNATTGKLDASGGGGGAGTWAQYSNFTALPKITVGSINVANASAIDVQGLTQATTPEIPLKANANYLVNAILNINCPIAPTSGATNLSYSGVTDNPPAYALSTANFTLNAGTITNGVFTSDAGNNNFGSLAANAYNNTYSITGYTISVNFIAVPYIVGRLSSASGNVYMYSQIGNNSPQGLLVKKSNVVTANQAAYASKAGGSIGFNVTTFTQPASGAPMNATVAMGVDNLAMCWDGATTVTRVAYSNNAMTANTPTWNQSTALANPITHSTWLLQAIGKTNACIVDQVTGATGVLDFASGYFANGSNLPVTDGQPVFLNFGSNGANDAYVATLSASPIIYYAAPDMLSGWFPVDLSTKGVTGNVNGIAYNPVTNRWVCSAWDGTTNRFYYSNSPTLPSASWTLASGTANQALSRIVGGYVAGGGYAFAIGCISLTSNVYTTINDTSWSIPSSIPTYSASILPYYIGGMFVCAPNFSSNPFIHTSTDGINFIKTNVVQDAYRCGGVGGNLIIPATPTAYQISLAYSYIFASSNFGNAIPQAAWSGNQQILSGVSATSSVNRSVIAVASYTQTGNNSLTAISSPRIGIPSGSNWFGVSLLGLCGGESVTSISAQLSYYANTVVVNLVGTNATLTATTPQTPFNLGSQQVMLNAMCRAGTTNPSVRLNVSYADGNNTLLPNSTITVTEV